MGVEFKKSHLSNETVQKVINKGYETVKHLNGGRNPSSEQREKIKNLVIQEAKKVERNRGSV